MKLSDKTYDFLKFVALILLPALAVFYLGFGELWGFPNTEKVATSIVLFDTFLGAVLQISSAKYNNDPANFEGVIGSTGADEDTGLPNIALTVTKHPAEVVSGKVARFRVADPAGPQHKRE